MGEDVVRSSRGATEADLYRGLKYDRETIERCLFETAAAAGNARKAAHVLAGVGINVPAQTIYNWISGRFRNRYQEIATTQADEIREVVARQALELAIVMGDAERQALDQTVKGIAELDAMEASQVLRNVTQAKSQNLDAESRIRNGNTLRIEVPGLAAIIDGLVRVGVAEVIDAEVVDDD